METNGAFFTKRNKQSRRVSEWGTGDDGKKTEPNTKQNKGNVSQKMNGSKTAMASP